jgi:hypothetical protein
MTTSRIPLIAALVCAGTLVGEQRASAIGTPDLNSQCSQATGGNGCFKMTNNNTSQALPDNTATGTAFTAVSAGGGTAIKAFTNGTSLGAAMMAVAGSGVGLKASSTSASGISTSSGSGSGITASSTSGTGVDGYTAANSGTAVSGRITGVGTGAKGVYGESLNGTGVYGATTGSSATAAGVYGTSSGYGVRGATTSTANAAGIYGTVPAAATISSTAILGDAQGSSASGVRGFSGNGWGMYGFSSTSFGIKAESNSGTALAAEAYGASSMAIYALSTGTTAIYSQPASTSNWAFYGIGGIHLDGSTAEKPGGGMWSPTSDRRVKKDVKSFDSGLAELMRVRPIRFKYNGLGGTEDNGKEYVGVIAQELAQILPSMVSTRQRKLHKEDQKDSDIQIVDPSDFTYLLINAVKQQQSTIQKQEARLAELERRSAPVAAAGFPGGLGAWAALALLPLGVMIGRRRR